MLAVASAPQNPWPHMCCHSAAVWERERGLHLRCCPEAWRGGDLEVWSNYSHVLLAVPCLDPCLVPCLLSWVTGLCLPLVGPFLGFYLNGSMTSSCWAVGCCWPAAGRRRFCPAQKEVILTPCSHSVCPEAGVGSRFGEIAQPGQWRGTCGAVALVMWCVLHEGW